MRLNELLYENHYRTHSDRLSVGHKKEWNPEAEFYADEQREKTKQMWKDADGGVPVITSPVKNPEDQNFHPSPMPGEMQSPGYRGEQKARRRANASYKPYDSGFPEYRMPID